MMGLAEVLTVILSDCFKSGSPVAVVLGGVDVNDAAVCSV